MKKNSKVLFSRIKRLCVQSPVCYYLLLLFVFYACSDDENRSAYDPNLPVEVSSIIPDSGTVNIPLVINGSNFGTDKSKIKVYFDNKEAIIISAKNEHLYVLNPKQTGGKHSIKVKVGDGSEGVLKNNQFKYIVSSSVITVAGSGGEGKADGPALEATFGEPDYLSIDDRGNIIVSDYIRYRIRLVSLADVKVTTLVDDQNNYGGCFSNDYTHFYSSYEGTGTKLGYDFYREGNWAKSLLVNDRTFDDAACDMAVDDNDDIFVIGCYGGIAKVDHITRAIKNLGSLPAYTGEQDFYMGYNPHDKHLYISSIANHVIIRVDSRKEQFVEDDFEIYAGRLNQSGANNGTLALATFNKPRGLDFDSEGNMYVADYNNHVIRKITLDGIVSTYAGSTAGHKDGVIEEALFNGPKDVAVSPEDFVYVADALNNRIRCIAVQ